jgi:PiT family inorganic phosphate transporter
VTPCTLVFIVIITTLIFAYTNGFHDSANAIATVISTKVMSPRKAILYGAVLNITGAFFGIRVAQTIGVGLVSSISITQMVILCALLTAIIWNLITWFYALPSSSSHGLIGGLIGSAVAHSHIDAVNIPGIAYKVIFPMITSPILGMLLAYLMVILLFRLFYRITPRHGYQYFGKMQIISSGLMAFSHGANDTQKSMGIITLSLITFYNLQNFDVPLWVIITCAVSMGLGTMIGGWRIMKTMGHKIVKLKPIDGFAAETSTALIILSASHFGMPVSTTHVISGAIIGAGGAKRFSAVKWNVFFNIVCAWILTIPACMLLSSILYHVIHYLSRSPLFPT